MNFFSLKNWSRYSRAYLHDQNALYKYKRVIILSQFTLFGTIAGTLHAIEDLVDGIMFMPMMDFTMACGVFVCYLLNENGYHKVARYALLSFLNIFFFVYCSLVTSELGIYLYYVAWIGLAALIFENEESGSRLFFIILSILLVLALFLTDFQVFGDISFPAKDIERSFIINLISSVVVLSVFIGLMTNINAQTEKKLYELAQEVKVKNDDLQRTNEELDRFLYSTSHDLRSPLMSIKGLIQIANEDTQDPKMKEYLRLMTGSADRLDFFIQDIIDYAKNAKTEISQDKFRLDELYGEVINNLSFFEFGKKISFQKEISIAEEVLCDKRRVSIILNNLIGNAIKYHRSGIENAWVKFTARSEGGNLVIMISDNGQGIAENQLPKIFNMFYRANATSKGSGLGLYIVKEAVEKLQGTIEVHSKLNEGSTFKVAIPIA